MTLTGLLGKARESLGPDALPGDLALRFLDDALARSDAREILAPAVFTWVRAEERARVREAKQEMPGEPKNSRNPAAERSPVRLAGSGEPEGTRSPMTARSLNPAERAMRDFLASTCYVPGQGRVLWGEMSAELHQLRIDWLTQARDRYVTAITATIRKHALVIGLLTESGCADLNSYAERYGALPDEATAVTDEEAQIPA